MMRDDILDDYAVCEIMAQDMLNSIIVPSDSDITLYEPWAGIFRPVKWLIRTGEC